MIAIRYSALGVACALFATTAMGATVSDLAQRLDVLSTSYVLDLGEVDEAAPANATALLAFWNSNGPNAPADPQMVLNFSVNAAFVTTFDLSSNNGFSDPLDVDISGLLVDGVNTFTFDIRDDFSGGDPGTFAVKDFTVTFREDDVAPVPLPAALPLMLLGLGGLYGLRRRQA